jgi:hypothetical protein
MKKQRETTNKVIVKQREEKYWVDEDGKEWLLHEFYDKEFEKNVEDVKKKHNCKCSKVKGGYPHCCPCGGRIHGQFVGHCAVCGGGACC